MTQPQKQETSVGREQSSSGLFTSLLNAPARISQPEEDTDRSIARTVRYANLRAADSAVKAAEFLKYEMADRMFEDIENNIDVITGRMTAVEKMNEMAMVCHVLYRGQKHHGDVEPIVYTILGPRRRLAVICGICQSVTCPLSWEIEL
jgi:hypothetical protein